MATKMAKHGKDNQFKDTILLDVKQFQIPSTIFANKKATAQGVDIYKLIPKLRREAQLVYASDTKHTNLSLYMSGTPYRWLTVFRKLDVVMSFASYLDQASSRRCCSTV
jgi:hypothetical protein